MAAKKYFPTEEELQIINDLYDGTSLKLNKIMRRLHHKYPRHYVRLLARKMGLARAQDSDWSPEEERYLFDNYPRKGLKNLQKGLQQITGGKPRSYNAINLKKKRLKILVDYDDGFTMRGLSRLLWGDPDQHGIIRQWVQKGWLRGKRRGTLRTKHQGGDMWYFSPERVRSFIIAHSEAIDLRRVEPLAFIRLLAGNSETLAICLCPKCKKEYEIKTFTISAVSDGVQWRYCDDCRGSITDEEEEYCLGAL